MSIRVFSTPNTAEIIVTSADKRGHLALVVHVPANFRIANWTEQGKGYAVIGYYS
jgi:hypothetical protein